MKPGYVPPPEDFEAAVLAQLTKDIDAMGLPAACNVQLHVVHGQSSAALLEAAPGVEIVVVGRRGAGGFRGPAVRVHRGPGGALLAGPGRRRPDEARLTASGRVTRSIAASPTSSCVIHTMLRPVNASSTSRVTASAVAVSR